MRYLENSQIYYRAKKLVVVINDIKYKTVFFNSETQSEC